MLIFQRYAYWAGAMVGLAMVFAVASQAGVLNPVQGVFLRVTSPIESGVGSVLRPVGAFVTDAGRIRSLQQENRELRLQVEDLQNQVAQLQQDAAEIPELRQALGIIDEAGGDTFEAASVLTRDAFPFSDVIRVNKGSNDGIRVGMVVRSTQGSLVGTVTETFPNQSLVRLISDSRSSVNAEIAGTAIEGNVRGSATKTVKFDLAQGNISTGDQVITSGVGDNYPRGLPIGTVVEVEGTPQDLYLDVTIEPHVRLSRLTTVLIETSFDPGRQMLEQQ